MVKDAEGGLVLVNIAQHDDYSIRQYDMQSLLNRLFRSASYGSGLGDQFRF